jgi:hypothetical protein
MLNTEIPPRKREANSHDSPTEFNSNYQDRQWEQQHMSEAKASIPWRSPNFWRGVTSSVGIVGIVMGALWYVFTSIVKSDWVEKPAKAHEVQELQESMGRIERRVEKVEQRVDGNAAKTDAKLDHITDLIIERNRGGGGGAKEAAK